MGMFRWYPCPVDVPASPVVWLPENIRSLIGNAGYMSVNWRWLRFRVNDILVSKMSRARRAKVAVIIIILLPNRWGVIESNSVSLV